MRTLTLSLQKVLWFGVGQVFITIEFLCFTMLSSEIFLLNSSVRTERLSGEHWIVKDIFDECVHIMSINVC